jgi:hypothetical protein
MQGAPLVRGGGRRDHPAPLHRRRMEGLTNRCGEGEVELRCRRTSTRRLSDGAGGGREYGPEPGFGGGGMGRSDAGGDGGWARRRPIRAAWKPAQVGRGFPRPHRPPRSTDVC